MPWIYLSLPLYKRKGFAVCRSYLNGVVVFPTFFNLGLNLAISSSWSEPQSAPGLVFAACIELLHPWPQKNIINLISVMCMCRVFSCVVGRGCLLWPVHSFGKTILAFSLLHSVFLHILNLGFPLGSSIELLHMVDACKYLINEWMNEWLSSFTFV